jgi:hypothetical protein
MGEQAGMLFRNPILQNPFFAECKNCIGNLLALVILVAFGWVAQDQVVWQIIWVFQGYPDDLARFDRKARTVIFHLRNHCRKSNRTVDLLESSGGLGES